MRLVALLAAALLAGCTVPPPPETRASAPTTYEFWLQNDAEQKVRAIVYLWMDDGEKRVCDKIVHGGDSEVCETALLVDGERHAVTTDMQLADGRKMGNLANIQCWQVQIFLSEFGPEIKHYCGT